jgi:methylated-DNA-[protein]-cysteine S-methyltransferase
MTDHGFALFETAVGPCGVAWGPDGILGVQLPEGDATRTRARLRRRFPQARETEAPEPARSAIGAIQALLSGEPRDLSLVALDWTGVGAFERRVYEVARAIRPGATLTYGEVAARIGETALAARDVGQALGRNPFPIVVPCHRVVAAGGKSGGFSARGGAATKLKLLRIEGAKAAGPPTLFD